MCGIPAEQALISCRTGSCRGVLSATAQLWNSECVCVWCQCCNLHILNMAVKRNTPLTDWLIIGQLYFCVDLGQNAEQSLVTPFDQTCPTRTLLDAIKSAAIGRSPG